MFHTKAKAIETKFDLLNQRRMDIAMQLYDKRDEPGFEWPRRLDKRHGLIERLPSGKYTKPTEDFEHEEVRVSLKAVMTLAKMEALYLPYVKASRAPTCRRSTGVRGFKRDLSFN